MNDLLLGRRDFLRLGIVAGVLGLSSCGISKKATLGSFHGILPKELLKSLPSEWRFKLLDSNISTDPYKTYFAKEIDLIAIGDGWLRTLDFKTVQPIGEAKLQGRLNRQAIIFLSSFGPDIASKLFPVGFSPWAMLFRGGGTWLPKAKETWEVLLEPDFEGKIVLPSSPRLVMSLADRMGYQDELRRLRGQAITFDDQNALNWIISGRAKVAVLPLQHCMGALSKDPRLRVVIPNQGAPLNWTILTRPKMSQEPLPYSWIKEAWELPLMGRLISKGWLPPLSYSETLKAINFLPKEHQSIIFSSEEVFDRFWSLSPLDEWDQKNS